MESGKYQLKFSYTQRIHRPSMTHLNPYKNTNDPLNISYGNPHLDAEVSHAFELGYSFFKDFGSIMITAFHRFTDNAIEQYSFLNGPIYETTYGNIGQNYTDGASIGTNLRKHNLTVSVNASGYYYEIKTNQPQLPANNTGFNYNLNLFTSYKINDYWTLQGWGSFNGPNYSVQGYSTSFYFYNVSGRREFKNKKGGIGFGIDNFATPYIHIKSKYEGSDFSYTSDNKIFFPGVRVSLDYRFGQMEFGSKRKKKIKNDDLKEGGGGGFGGGGDEGGEEKK
jgi:outer membrane cobalamin receptor